MALELLLEIRRRNPSTHMGCLQIDYSDDGVAHWADKESALKDFAEVKEFVLLSKKNKIRLKINLPDYALETPYYHFFAAIAE